jgi:CDP-diacylglycerol---serine O-phosphatidyltransferase
MTKIPIKKMLPNIFTFLNLAFGMMSILLTITGNEKSAAVMILCSAFVDRYDGKIARKINMESDLGKELDSLCDLISFGVAPAVLCWSAFLSNYGALGYVISIIFPIAGAYRLARFNVAEIKGVFIGIPITVAGAFLALDVLISLALISHDTISTVLMLFLTYMMISKFKFKKM